MLFSQESDKAFLVSDSCRARVRNGSSVSEEFTEDTIELSRHDACFSYLQILLLLFLGLLDMDKHDIRYIVSKILNRLLVAVKESWIGRHMFAFLPVSKALKNKLYIFTTCTYIVCVKYTCFAPGRRNVREYLQSFFTGKK